MERLFDLLIWLLFVAVAWLIECYEALRVALGMAMVMMTGCLAQLGAEIARAIASFLIVVAVVVVAVVAAIAVAIVHRRRGVALAPA